MTWNAYNSDACVTWKDLKYGIDTFLCCERTGHAKMIRVVLYEYDERFERSQCVVAKQLQNFVTDLFFSNERAEPSLRWMPSDPHFHYISCFLELNGEWNYNKNRKKQKLTKVAIKSFHYNLMIYKVKICVLDEEIFERTIARQPR